MKLATVPSSDRAQYEAVFLKEATKHGKSIKFDGGTILDGDICFEMFSRSGLSHNDLGEIW